MNIDWYKELIEIAKGFRNVQMADLELYFLGDESKREEELLITKSDVKLSKLDSDRRGTLEMKYVRPIMLRAKPLTALDLCFSGEHEEVAILTLSKQLPFFPTNGPGVMYFEATTTSLAKRNGGATIGFSLEYPYSMPGASWYTFGYSVDSGIIRNGIGIPPIKGVSNGLKKPKLGDVWGVGYQVRFKEPESIAELSHRKDDMFYDDNSQIRGPLSPYRTSFFVTCNGVLKYFAYINATPLLMQPAIMLANTNDSIILNVSGDGSHPFRFNLDELARIERPSNLRGRNAYQIMVGPGAAQHAAMPRLPPLLSPPYTPIAQKTLRLSNEELSAYAGPHFAAINGSYRKLSALDELCAKNLPFSVSQDMVELDVNAYYEKICSELAPDEARNIILHMNPQMSNDDQVALLNDQNPSEQLRTNARQLILEFRIKVIFEYEAYVRNFANLRRLLDTNHLPPTPAPGSNCWAVQLFHPDHPFPLSRNAQQGIRVARAVTDAVTHQLRGVYQTVHTWFEHITGKNMLDSMALTSDEVGWAESQLRRLILGLPTTKNPSCPHSLNPKFCITHASTYIDLFDIITTLRQDKIIDLAALELSPSLASTGQIAPFPLSNFPISQFTFPSQDALSRWATTASTAWLECFLWNAYLSLPVVPDLELDATKPVFPEDVKEAFQTVMAMIAKERKRLTRASLASGAVNRLAMPTPSSATSRSTRSASTPAEVQSGAGNTPSTPPPSVAVSVTPGGAMITPSSLIAVKPLDRANEAQLELHIEALRSILQQCDESATICTSHLLLFGQTSHLQLLKPLPLPTDPPVPITPEIQRHGYFFVCDQIHQLHFLIGPHPILIPLIEWRISIGLAKVEEVDRNMALQRHTRYLHLERQAQSSKEQAAPMPNQHYEFIHPVTPKFNNTPKDRSTVVQKPRPAKVRPVAIAAIGAFVVSIGAAIGYLGYSMLRVPRNRVSRQ